MRSERYSIFSLLRESFRGHTGWRPVWREPEPKPDYDVVIIGGGGHGLATAYYLAKNFAQSRIAVVEKASIGLGNVGRNTTIIRSNYLLPGPGRGTLGSPAGQRHRDLRHTINPGGETCNRDNTHRHDLGWRSGAGGARGELLHLLHMGEIIPFLAQNKLPGMFQVRDDIVAGGLISYGASLPDLFRHAAGYVHRILQGTKPSDSPVEQPTKFELVIKTAKAVGLDVPNSLLVSAEEVIE
jgi:glycine/D-amino acid oxidase-like deaminating enzyme